MSPKQLVAFWDRDTYVPGDAAQALTKKIAEALRTKGPLGESPAPLSSRQIFMVACAIQCALAAGLDSEW